MEKRAGRKLTDFEIGRTPSNGKRLELSDAGGPLRLVIQPSGSRSWAVRYRFGGRTRKHTLGPYPAISVADARDLCSDALKKVHIGIDPGVEKRNARERERDTIKALVAEYIEKWQKPRNRTWAEVESSLERILVSRFGARDVRDVTRQDLIRALDGRSRVTVAMVKRFFAWCVERAVIETSPAAAVKADTPPASRDRVLSDDELRTFLIAIRGMSEPWPPLLELLAFTAQRRSEVAEAEWAEFDLDGAIWTIAAERSKNGLAHIVPLAPRPLAILKALRKKASGKATLVFPSSNGGEGSVSGFSKSKTRLDALMLDEMRSAAGKRRADVDKIKLEPWRIHDLRRTSATGMARLGHSISIVERVLNHQSGATVGGLVSVYQKHDFLSERRAALEAWAQFVEGLRNGK